MDNYTPAFKYDITTKIKASGEIEMTLSSMGQEISRQIMHTKDKAIRQALISLGWTPPDAQPKWWVVEMSLCQCDKAFSSEASALEYQRITTSALPKPPVPVWAKQ